MDTSFSVAALNAAGHDLASDRELFGQVLESWVVNQVTASAGWGNNQIEAHYWRKASTNREVDLVPPDDPV